MTAAYRLLGRVVLVGLTVGAAILVGQAFAGRASGGPAPVVSRLPVHQAPAPAVASPHAPNGVPSSAPAARAPGGSLTPEPSLPVAPRPVLSLPSRGLGVGPAIVVVPPLPAAASPQRDLPAVLRTAGVEDVQPAHVSVLRTAGVEDVRAAHVSVLPRQARWAQSEPAQPDTRHVDGGKRKDRGEQHDSRQAASGASDPGSDPRDDADLPSGHRR